MSAVVCLGGIKFTAEASKLLQNTLSDTIIDEKQEEAQSASQFFSSLLEAIIPIAIVGKGKL